MTKQYTAPKLAKVGSFEEITKSANYGSHFDGAYTGHLGTGSNPLSGLLS